MTDDLDVRHLRPALEFAVLVAREGQKLKPPLAHPDALRPYLKLDRLPAAKLASVRRILESEPEFRARLAAGALPDLVDEIGRLWLARPQGWEDEVARLARDVEVAEEDASLRAALKRADKRRDAAERVAARVSAEVIGLQRALDDRSAQVDELRADVAKLTDALAEARNEVIDARNEARHARDREAAATARADAADRGRADADAARRAADGVRDDALAERTVRAEQRAELLAIGDAVQEITARLERLIDPPQRSSGEAARAAKAARRVPLAMPGAVLRDSDAAAEFLVRAAVPILVDGYNVAKLGWPDLDLATQRAVLVDACEVLARRTGADLTVVFDGADVVGAAAGRRRVVRVVFSRRGVLADDVLRDEVRRLPLERPVVVVTNDQAVVRDVRALGANTLSSDQFLAVARR